MSGSRRFLPFLGDVLGMFLVSGDHNLVSNMPSRPVLGPFLALPFLIGLGMTLRRFWRLGRLFLLAGLGVMLLPTVLSDYAPNFFRAIGALPFTALLIAYGAEAFVGYSGLFQRGEVAPTGGGPWMGYSVQRRRSFRLDIFRGLAVIRGHVLRLVGGLQPSGAPFQRRH